MDHKNEPYIVCAANRYGEIIITGARHFDGVMHQAIKYIWPADDHRKEVCAEMEQGFIDQYCKFYTREEAWGIAQSNNQINYERNGPSGKLYSEGLY